MTADTQTDDDKTEPYEYRDREIESMEGRGFKFGDGKISGALACSLGILSFLTVLCFKFPAYLTTAELRAAYDPEFLQTVLKYGIFASLAFSTLTFMIGKYRRWAAIGALMTIAALALGGYNIKTGPVAASNISFGLDWLVLAFLVSAILFIFLEKVFPKYKSQAILRPDWKLDLFYFGFNHLLITILLLTGNFFVAEYFGWAVSDTFQAWIQSFPLWAQVIALLVCADFVLILVTPHIS